MHPHQSRQNDLRLERNATDGEPELATQTTLPGLDILQSFWHMDLLQTTCSVNPDMVGLGLNQVFPDFPIADLATTHGEFF